MQFQVDAAQVEQAATRVNGSADTISGEVDAMMKHLNELQSTWQGSASASFQDVAQDWRSTQSRVEESLISIRQALSSAAQQYTSAEESALRMFQG